MAAEMSSTCVSVDQGSCGSLKVELVGLRNLTVKEPTTQREEQGGAVYRLVVQALEGYGKRQRRTQVKAQETLDVDGKVFHKGGKGGQEVQDAVHLFLGDTCSGVVVSMFLLGDNSGDCVGEVILDRGMLLRTDPMWFPLQKSQNTDEGNQKDTVGEIGFQLYFAYGTTELASLTDAIEGGNSSAGKGTGSGGLWDKAFKKSGQKKEEQRKRQRDLQRMISDEDVLSKLSKLAEQSAPRQGKARRSDSLKKINTGDHMQMQREILFLEQQLCEREKDCLTAAQLGSSLVKENTAMRKQMEKLFRENSQLNDYQNKLQEMDATNTALTTENLVLRSQVKDAVTLNENLSHQNSILTEQLESTKKERERFHERLSTSSVDTRDQEENLKSIQICLDEANKENEKLQGQLTRIKGEQARLKRESANVTSSIDPWVELSKLRDNQKYLTHKNKELQAKLSKQLRESSESRISVLNDQLIEELLSAVKAVDPSVTDDSLMASVERKIHEIKNTSGSICTQLIEELQEKIHPHTLQNDLVPSETKASTVYFLIALLALKIDNELRAKLNQESKSLKDVTEDLKDAKERLLVEQKLKMKVEERLEKTLLTGSFDVPPSAPTISALELDHKVQLLSAQVHHAEVEKEHHIQAKISLEKRLHEEVSKFHIREEELKQSNSRMEEKLIRSEEHLSELSKMNATLANLVSAVDSLSDTTMEANNGIKAVKKGTNQLLLWKEKNSRVF